MQNKGRNCLSAIVSTCCIFLQNAPVGRGRKKQTCAVSQRRFCTIRPLPLIGRGVGQVQWVKFATAEFRQWAAQAIAAEVALRAYIAARKLPSVGSPAFGRKTTRWQRPAFNAPRPVTQITLETESRSILTELA